MKIQKKVFINYPDDIESILANNDVNEMKYVLNIQLLRIADNPGEFLLIVETK